MKLKITAGLVLALLLPTYLAGVANRPVLFVFLVWLNGTLLALALLSLLALLILDPVRWFSAERRAALAGYRIALRVVVSFAFVTAVVYFALGGIDPVVRVAPAPGSTPDLATLQALPYVGFVMAEGPQEEDGVLVNEPDSVGRGLNLYNSVDLPGARLLDASGKVLHSWLSPDPTPDWHYVRMGKDGDLFVVRKDRSLMLLDSESRIRWEANVRAHHDVAVDGSGDVYVLSRKDEVVFVAGIPVPILHDHVVILYPDGRIKREIALYPLLRQAITPGRALRAYPWMMRLGNMLKVVRRGLAGTPLFEDVRVDDAVDMLHVNTLGVIDRDLGTPFTRGNILICSKKLDLVGVIDIAGGKLAWSWGRGELQRPHHPTLLGDGHVLIFDNGYYRGSSRVIEVDPKTNRIVWEYAGSPPDSFFTSWGGASQRLPGGNTLVTQSSRGRVFEVTPGGRLVWEFHNPVRDSRGRRATVYRMTRITNPESYSFLGESPEP